MRIPGGAVLNCWGGGAANTSSSAEVGGDSVTKIILFYNGPAIGVAVGILAAALVFSWLGSPLALVRRISGPPFNGFGPEVFVFPAVLAVLGGVFVWLACVLRERGAKPQTSSHVDAQNEQEHRAYPAFPCPAYLRFPLP